MYVMLHVHALSVSLSLSLDIFFLHTLYFSIVFFQVLPQRVTILFLSFLQAEPLPKRSERKKVQFAAQKPKPVSVYMD